MASTNDAMVLTLENLLKRTYILDVLTLDEFVDCIVCVAGYGSLGMLGYLGLKHMTDHLAALWPILGELVMSSADEALVQNHEGSDP